MEQIPRDLPVALLMRHAARHPITDPSDPFAAGLTEEGILTAEELGKEFGERFQPGKMVSSPVERCIATGKAIARGAGWPDAVIIDERLSHLFIAPAWGMVNSSRMTGPVPFQVRIIMHWILRVMDTTPRLDVMVTHDTVLGAVVGGLLHVPVTNENWPGYLEGMFIWRGEQGVCARWRGIEYLLSEKQLRIE
jgi:hypothetical protein